jgi:hypothetical protein
LRDPNKRVILDSIPEPFIGDPASARVALLGLNPGHSKKDRKAHNDPCFRKAMFHNLRHEEQDYRFYPLNPAFAWTGAGKWWLSRTRELREAVGGEPSTFAKRLLVIEWFPYHTVTAPDRAKRICGMAGRICESQTYTFQLAKALLDRNLPIVMMRAKDDWVKVDHRFEEAPSLNSRQNAYLTRKNMNPDVFERVVSALKVDA